MSHGFCVEEEQAVDAGTDAKPIVPPSPDILKREVFSERPTSFPTMVEIIRIAVESVEPPGFHDPQESVGILKQRSCKCRGETGRGLNKPDGIRLGRRPLNNEEGKEQETGTKEFVAEWKDATE
jgi:hypothetical protein